MCRANLLTRLTASLSSPMVSATVSEPRIAGQCDEHGSIDETPSSGAR
jgi:hypothetical protein